MRWRPESSEVHMTVTSPRFMRVYDAERLKTALRAVGPPLLFGFRLWASVCLALYVAFWLELDNAFWAGYTAVTVSQPHLGVSAAQRVVPHGRHGRGCGGGRSAHGMVSAGPRAVSDGLGAV